MKVLGNKNNTRNPYFQIIVMNMRACTCSEPVWNHDPYILQWYGNDFAELVRMHGLV